MKKMDLAFVPFAQQVGPQKRVGRVVCFVSRANLHLKQVPHVGSARGFLPG